MATTDPRVYAYIERAAPFAQPILAHMAAFKQHCAFGFWKGRGVVADQGKAGEAMGQFGRITALADLPPKRELVATVKRAVARIDAA